MGGIPINDSDRELLKVLGYNKKELEAVQNIRNSNAKKLDSTIADAEDLLESLGYGPQVAELKKKAKGTRKKNPPRTVRIPSWEELLRNANEAIPEEVSFEDLLTEEQIADNHLTIQKWQDEYNALHKLDKYDVAIAAAAGLLGAAMDILLVGIPHSSPEGVKAGRLSDYIRDAFDKVFPQEEMNKLAQKKGTKVSYDAQDNRNTAVTVEGLSSGYHRLYSLGHDPLLGLFIGVYDIMHGTMTTIDKTGRIVSQVMDVYGDRIEPNIFKALWKQIKHFASDVTTPAGLPAPLMGLFNLMQFGSIGEEENTIAEVVQGMYYEKYDFAHFCSMSIPVAVTEVVVRLGYAIKRIKEGHSVKESIPVSLKREKHPKLATMLFIAHSAAAAINAGKVCFTKNPMAINFPQWLAFGKYSYQQLKWLLVQKPEARKKFVEGRIGEEFHVLYEEIEGLMGEFEEDFNITFEPAWE